MLSTNQESIYIAGPMTGHEGYNYAAFHSAEKLLKRDGYKVYNPARIKEEDLPAKGTATYTDWLKAAITLMMKADSVMFLPGWEDGNGAAVEFILAKSIGMNRYLPSRILQDVASQEELEELNPAPRDPLAQDRADFVVYT